MLCYVRCLSHILRDRAGLDRTFHPQRAPKSAASHRLIETFGLDMKVCPPAGEPTGRIRDHAQCTVGSDHNSQQL